MTAAGLDTGVQGADAGPRFRVTRIQLRRFWFTCDAKVSFGDSSAERNGVWLSQTRNATGSSIDDARLHGFMSAGGSVCTKRHWFIY